MTGANGRRGGSPERRPRLNRLWYLWKRNGWMLDPRSWLGRGRDAPVDRPIFLLGVQGGGLTLLSRMLRRHPDVVSVTGDRRYWSGADEMHTVLGPILPAELTGTRYKVPRPDHPLFLPPRSWTYASDELLPLYRKTAADATPAAAAALRRAIGLCLVRHSADPRRARFLDKSQVYTVRVSFLRALLAGRDPRFVLIPMDPYVACAKAASGRAADMKRLAARLPFDDRLRICAEHWSNSMACALADRGEDTLVVRFEDVLADPASALARILSFAGLAPADDLRPREGQRIPFGSRFPDRWHPLQPDRHAGLLRELEPRHRDIVSARCGEIAERFGYGNDAFRAGSLTPAGDGK